MSPQLHFGPQVQGRHEQRLLEHSFDMSSLLPSPVVRTVWVYGTESLAEMSDPLHIAPMGEGLDATRKVVLVGYGGAQSLDLVGPFEVFSMANRFGNPHGYEVILASPDGGTIVCNSGLQLGGSLRLADLPADLDTILVAGGSEDALRRVSEERVLAWLSECARTTRRLGSVCSGALVLAAAGVLDGRRATTHWDYCEKMRRFWPAVRLEPDAIFVERVRAHGA